jgi:hypothetical protein
MYSGARDGIIQSGMMYHTMIHIPSRLLSRIQLTGSTETRVIIIGDQKISGPVTSACRQNPVIPLLSSMAITGEQQE